MKQICKLCKSEAIEVIKNGVRDNKSIDVLKCKNCGLEFLSNVNCVDNTFYEDGKMHSSVNRDIWIEGTKPDDLRRFKDLKTRIKNKKLLDFGSGSGNFLIQSREVVKKCVGIEIDESLTEYFNEKGLEIYDTIDKLNEKFDYITMFHVLEHLSNPVEMINTVSKYLEKDGKLVLEVPSNNDILLKGYKNEAFKNFTYWSCHVFMYDEKSLRELFKHTDLKIDKVKYVQRYPLTNHLYWIKYNKPAGHKIWSKYNYRIVDMLYSLFLKMLKQTDTIVIEVSFK